MEWLFQTPNSSYRLPMDPWFKRTPCGVNKINNFLKEICKRAGVDFKYTNHCLCGTTINAMKANGHDAFETAHVTLHKDPNSIKSYLAKPTLKQKCKYAKSLVKYIEESSTESDSDSDNASDASDFDPPPPPPKKKKNAKKTKNKPTATISKPPDDNNNENDTNTDKNMALVSIDNPTDGNVSLPLIPQNQQTTTTNNLAMLKQNPVGMFMGANLNNCTININIPK